jgi:hypothetical protein
VLIRREKKDGGRLRGIATFTALCHADTAIFDPSSGANPPERFNDHEVTFSPAGERGRGATHDWSARRCE